MAHLSGWQLSSASVSTSEWRDNSSRAKLLQVVGKYTQPFMHCLVENIPSTVRISYRYQKHFIQRPSRIIERSFMSILEI
jgi:hypothetical protein